MTRDELRQWIKDGCHVDSDGDFVLKDATYFDRFWVQEALMDLLTDYDTAMKTLDGIEYA